MITTKMASAILAAGAAALLIPTVAFADEAETVVRGERGEDVPVGYVKFRDVNLGSDDGITTLRSRIRRVANNICLTQGHKDLGRKMAERACRDTAIQSAEPQIASVVQRFRAGEFAALTPIAIVGVK